MTEIAYHPTHVRALRETFKALRTAEFPWTADTIYLNNASIGPIPERTRRALDEFTAKRTAPHLLPDRELFAGLAAARLGIAQLINCDPSEVALATNTGYGLNLAARALPLKPGDVVLLSDKEFPANVYPWLLLRDEGITVEVARCRPEGWPDEEYLLQRLRDPRVRVLAVSFVQFSNGYRADLQKLSAACRANGTYLVVDGIQGIGNSVLDVTETPVDILACGGQKWLLSLRSDARRFEMITLPYQDFVGMTSSLALLLEIGVRDIAEVTRAAHEPVVRWAQENDVRISSPLDERHRSAILCVAPSKPVEAYHAMKRARVVCSLREGSIRLSPHCYNTVEEMEKVIEVLEDLL
ncbi:MAG: hypothetical protein AUH41_04420 [Gemmatimonadetes bacterium 13_1_40CM_66_11]|nr:MAG: hypothetical protein AUH41_04420 [Gemmatimonadetes bacterium 13_1_40CM_66_11]